MKVTITGRQMNVWSEMEATIEKKLSKLDKYFGDNCSATATLSSQKNEKCIEITIYTSDGTIFRSEVKDETFRTALDRCVYVIERQIRKNKTRLAKKLREGAFDKGMFDTDEDFEEEKEFVTKKKSFTIKPVSVEEAIMQMNLIDHEFFVFIDDKSNEVSIVYKRKSGDYGIIETHR